MRGGFYPGVQIRRLNCGKRYIGDGYTEVQKCKEVSSGTPCVTEAEMERSERPALNNADRLQELRKLREQGLITEEEYEAKRRQILDRL